MTHRRRSTRLGITLYIEPCNQPYLKARGLNEYISNTPANRPDKAKLLLTNNVTYTGIVGFKRNKAPKVKMYAQYEECKGCNAMSTNTMFRSSQ